ncbi:hypothetical protein [Streptomyces sp. NRRL F-5630]|uniref:hypothetical protein n=1 Tax=Streptomyces sp. NRRL F-5630 TaxID=1463864 RepID=UPI003D703C24
MNRNENGPQVLESPRDREDLAGGGGSAPTVPDGEGARQTAEERLAEAIDRATHGDLAALWAMARTAYFEGDYPLYASREWRALHPDDPRRMAGALDAAEKWRKYGDDEDLFAWFRDVYRVRDPLASRRSRAELDEAAKPKPVRPLEPTPGWPPIRVPGQPGRYLTYTERRLAA